MRVLIGIIFFVLLSIITAFILYTFLAREKPKPKIRIKPKRIARPKTALLPPAQAQTPTRHRYELPPEIPRDINTMKIIAREDPQIIIDIIRKWMRER